MFLGPFFAAADAGLSGVAALDSPFLQHNPFHNRQYSPEGGRSPSHGLNAVVLIFVQSTPRNFVGGAEYNIL